MFRTDAEANDAGNYTEGDPQTAVPATVVSAEHMNAIQDELIKPIEEMGIALNKPTSDQLWLSLLELGLRGGRKTMLSHVLVNDTVDQVVAGFTMNKSDHKAKIALFNLERKTATQIVSETGILFCNYDSKNDQWNQEVISGFGDDNTSFAIDNADTDAAQLEVSTEDLLVGGGYVGDLRFTMIIEIKNV